MLIRIQTNIGIWRVEIPTDDGNNAQRGSNTSTNTSSSTHGIGIGIGSHHHPNKNTSHNLTHKKIQSHSSSGNTPIITVQDILTNISKTKPNVIYLTPLCFDPACKKPVQAQVSLAAQNITHGSMLYCTVDPSTVASTVVASNLDALSSSGPSSSISTPDTIPPTATTNTTTAAAVTALSSKFTKRIIAADGSIQYIHDSTATHSSSHADRGFRKGMLPLRDMKMQWTLNDFISMDNQFVYKIKRQEERWIGSGGVSLDTQSAHEFQNYLRSFQFQRSRIGFLYGRFVYDEKGDEKEEKIQENTKQTQAKEQTYKKQKVIVEAIYEPPQDIDPQSQDGLAILRDEEDSHAQHVHTVATSLGLQRVGWIYGHKPREPGFQMSNIEIITAAELQLEAAGGIQPTPFVTIKVTLGEDGQNTSFEAFQVSQQAMEMVAEGALEVCPTDPKLCQVHETFTAIKEGKESKTVEGDFFLTVIPIVQHTSETFVCEFPKLNREIDDRHPSHDEMKRQLSKSGTAGWTFVDLLADFNLLVYLCDYLDPKTDIPKICASILDRTNVPLDDGYRLIIAAMANLDNAF